MPDLPAEAIQAATKALREAAVVNNAVYLPGDEELAAVLALRAAAPHIAAAERERIRQLAIKHQATYWVGPDDHPAPRRPFALLLQFGDLEPTP